MNMYKKEMFVEEEICIARGLEPFVVVWRKGPRHLTGGRDETRNGTKRELMASELSSPRGMHENH